MKHTLKRVSSLLLALCITMLMSGGQFVMASDLTVGVTYQQNTASWKIDGTAGIRAHTAVTLKVYRTELGSLSASDILANGGFVKLVYTSSGGAFTDTVSLGTFFPSGSYTVEVSASGHTSATASFMHVNPDEAAGIIENVNLAASKAAVGQILSANCYQLGIDATEYSAKSASIDEIIFHRKPADGYDTQSFLSEYNNALCVYDLKNTADTLSQIFTNHSESIDYNYATDISVHGEDVVNDLRQRLQTEDYRLLSITETIRQNLLVSRILMSTRYTYVEGIISGEIADGVYDLTNYNPVINKEDVYKEVYTNKAQILKYADIKTVFESAAKKVYDAENPPANSGYTEGGYGNSGGGGGGGGGSSKGNVGITHVEVSTENTDVLSGKATFNDVKNHWATEYISYMADNAITNGYPDGSFRPEGLVTRAEFVKFVAVAFNLSLKDTNVNFADVSESDWFSSYINIATSNGIVNGADGSFRPNESLSRQDAAVILARLTKDIENNADAKDFGDYNEISQYAKEAVQKLSAMGIINGVDNNFLPKNNITRAEAAAMIVRIKKM